MMDDSAACRARLTIGLQLRFMRISIVADPPWVLWARASLPQQVESSRDAAVHVYECHDARGRSRTSLCYETVVGACPPYADTHDVLERSGGRCASARGSAPRRPLGQPRGGARGCRGGASGGPALAGAAVSRRDVLLTSAISAAKFAGSAGMSRSGRSTRMDTAWDHCGWP